MMTRHLQTFLGLIILLASQATCIPRWGLKDQQKVQDFSVKQDPDYYRLPKDLIPLEYDVHIIPYLETPTERAFTFEGHVKVLFNVTESTLMIWLHSFGLVIKDFSVQALDEDEPERISSWDSNYDDRELFRINLTKSMNVSSLYELNINFTGTLKDDLFGLYRSSYKDENDNTRWLAATFFEAAGARRAFPCWDEPLFRSNFTLHVAHQSDYHVIANMPKSGEDTPLLEKPELDGWMWSHFEPTLETASYLLAFVVSDFKSLSHPIDIRETAWARPGAENQTEYGLNFAARAVTYMQNYTSYIYPLLKMDHVALPDFVAGAMENWGLITYRETALLLEKGVSSVLNRQRVATVVTHEVAHQWFGNLVTPKWWDNIWLNEGFATYFEYHAFEFMEPDWDMNQQFITEEMYSAFQTDGLESTHPLVDTVNNPNGYVPVFDGLAYTKGGPLVRFMTYLMGEETFKLGINSYLGSGSYSNVDSDDLWEALQPYVPENLLPEGTDLRKVMRTWIKQPGYPVLKVIRDYDMKTAIVIQSRFVTYRSGSLPLDEMWIIPLTFTSKGDSDFDDVDVKAWIEGNEVTLELEATADQWVIFNVQQAGFYRVNYDQENWAMLSKALLSQTRDIHVINRAQLMDDALALARANLLDYNTALDTTSYLHLETEYAPWAAALTAMSYVYDRLTQDSNGKSLTEWYMMDKLKNIYSYLGGVSEGVEEEAHITKILRILVLRWACELGYKQCRDDAKHMFSQWQEQPDPEQQNPITPDLRSVVYCAGMRDGGQEVYDFLFQRYTNAKVASEQEILLKSLSCASDTTLLEKLLFASITPESGIRAQDAKNVFTYVYSNSAGVDLAFQFLTAFYQEAALAYGGLGSVSGLFSGLATKLNTQEQFDELELFIEDHGSEFENSLASLEAAKMTVQQNLLWTEQYHVEVVSYFSSKRADSGAPATLTVSYVIFVITLVLLI